MNNRPSNKLHAMPLPARLFLAVVGIPTLLAGIYYGLIASDVYIAEAKYALRVNADAPAVGLMESFLSSGTGLESANEDASIVMDFIRSREMMQALDEKLNLREHYTSGDVDFLSRLDEDASREEFLAYYQQRVSVGTDTASTISTLRVRAYDPQMANAIAQTIIELSEDLVNNLSDRIVEDSLQFARDEVENAEARVRAASSAMTRFRSENQSINPGEETKAVLGIITELETRLAAARAQLLEARSYMQGDSTQVQVLEGKVRALEQQAISERKRLSADEGTDTDYTILIDTYEPLVLEQELATKQYASTLASLELARIEAQRKQRYLLPFVPPQVPDEALEPNRMKSVATIFLALCLTYAIGALVWAAIKDHMRI